MQAAGDAGRGELLHGQGAVVGDEFHPGVARLDECFNLGQGQVFFQLQRQGQRVAAHGADAHAQTIDGDGGGGAQDFVHLGLALPLFFGLAVLELGVNPGNQATGQRSAKELGRYIVANGVRHLAVDFQNSRCGGGQLVGHGVVDNAHAFEQFAHVVGPTARSSLVGHGADPFDQPGLEQAAHAHQQDGVGAVAANPVLAARSQLGLNQVVVDRVQHDDGVVFHAQ